MLTQPRLRQKISGLFHDTCFCYWLLAELRTRRFQPQISSAIQTDAVVTLAEEPRTANDPKRNLALGRFSVCIWPEADVSMFFDPFCAKKRVMEKKSPFFRANESKISS